MDIRLLAPIATLCACLVTVTITLTLWWLNKQRKHVSIFTIRAEPLIAMKGSARDKLQVLFADQSVEEAYLLHLSLCNDGNVPVTLSDYHSPFLLELNPDARILEVDVIETWPADLDRRLPGASSTSPKSLIQSVAKSSVELTPVLLNPRDEIVMQVLVDNYRAMHISQHINGIKRVDLWSESRLIPKILTTFGAVIIIFAAFFLEPDQPSNFALPSIPYVLIILLGMILYIAGITWPKAQRSRQFGAERLAMGRIKNQSHDLSAEGT